jgi:predicted nicotinamide N-methyase
LQHRTGDLIDIAAFSFCPFRSWTTELMVSGKILRLAQWPGTRVGSGGFVWGGARRLSAYLERYGDGVAGSAMVLGRPWSGGVQKSQIKPLRVLDLGSGTGALGLTAFILGADVTLTDQASFKFPGDRSRLGESQSLLDLLRLNVGLNSFCALADSGDVVGLVERRVQVCELLWGDAGMESKLPHSCYDLIVAADVLLFTSAHVALLHTICNLSGEGTVVLIEHTDRGHYGCPDELHQFLSMVASDGRWAAAIVQDHGCHRTLRMVRH